MFTVSKSDKQKVTSSIILAGDPKQLDAFTKSEVAIAFDFKKSFMERLFEENRYSTNTMGQYNPNYIVQLRNNYRSHPDILCIPNKLFYCNTLECKANEGL